MGWNKCLSLLILLSGTCSEGAAVPPAQDLASLLHQYEDQFLGRQVRGLPTDEEAGNPEAEDNSGSVGHPVELHGWGDNLHLGQVSGVSVNLEDDPVVLHRGPVVWDGTSFDPHNQLVARNGAPIAEDVILVVDQDKGKNKSSWGAGMFFMPHGINVDQEGNTWVTDVGLHQVFKFTKDKTQPSLVLGTKFVPGKDKGHFCKPTSTAVASTGQLFVADGYCNKRVAVFDHDGQHEDDIEGDWTVVHSIVLYEQEDILCVADREGRQVECVGAGLKSPQFRGQSASQIKGLGRVFAIAGRGAALLAVNGKGSYFDPEVRGVTVDLASDNHLVDEWGSELVNPHDITISRSGDSVYVAEIGPNTLRKFEVVSPQPEIY